MGFFRDIILGPDKNDKEKQEDFDEFMELQKKRKEEIKNKKRNIFSMDEEVEGNDDMFEDVDFLNDEDKKEEER
jgi:hypothetical protein